MESAGLTRVWHRFYADFLLPSRLAEYEQLLKQALQFGYETIPVSRFWELALRGEAVRKTRLLILRHDIDTGAKTARTLWQAERRLGITGSYYFRLSTIDIELMKAIAAQGGEASYHYEELARWCKQKGLASIDEVQAQMPHIRSVFSRNLRELRARTGLPMTVVASHGDFINRKLGIRNTAILDDPELRQELGIQLEVYDKEFLDTVTARFSDAAYPQYWRPASPVEAIRAGSPVVYLLIHPRQWQAERLVNAADDINRAAESIAYRLRRSKASHSRKKEAGGPG